MDSSGKESALSKRRFTHVDAVHVHDNLPSRQDAQPQVPWRHNVGGAESTSTPDSSKSNIHNPNQPSTTPCYACAPLH